MESTALEQVGHGTTSARREERQRSPGSTPRHDRFSLTSRLMLTLVKLDWTLHHRGHSVGRRDLYRGSPQSM